MLSEVTKKISEEHMDRNAYLYVRQSTVRQVLENTESTKRQYALKERAIAMGWPEDRITIIDSDLGKSGSSSADREGFKRLVSEVGMGNAGIVIGLEVSRLARNSSDWHRLLEICALTKTLILDEEGIYDPAQFNDRLLLGLKGTMSEAELHVIKQRLHGGALAKAARGELNLHLPMGFVYRNDGKVILDPDKQVRQTIELFFDTFRRIGTANGTVKYFKENNLPFPYRIRTGTNKGELVWRNLVYSRAIQILHNARYAGAYFYGRMKSWKLPAGKTKYKILPQDKWHTLIKNAHEGYISWEEYEANQKRIFISASTYGAYRRKSLPREGSALLQGMTICGVCGKRITVHYHTRYKSRRIPYYLCQREGIENVEPICQSINGEVVDNAISELLIKSFTPLALEVSLNVQDELKTRFEETDRLRRKHVERAEYETDLARRRYMQVDPGNRLVAGSLEADWNEKMRALRKAQEEYERQREKDIKIFSTEEREKILSLATDFPGLWNDPDTPCREKKRMIRLLISDVTLKKNEDRTIQVYIRFRGGACKSIQLPAPVKACDLNRTSKEIITYIDILLYDYTDAEISDILNKEGKRSGTGMSFSPLIVATIRRNAGLKSRFERLREKKLLTLDEISEKLKLSTKAIREWGRKGIIKTYKFNDRNSCLYELDKGEIKMKLKEEKQKGGVRMKSIRKVNDCNSEVQYGI